MSIIDVIVADVNKIEKFVVAEVEGAAVVLWNDVKPILAAVEPAVYADLRAVVLGIVTAFEGKDLATIEAAILNTLEAGGTALFAEAQKLGSNILQLIIQLVKTL